MGKVTIIYDWHDTENPFLKVTHQAESEPKHIIFHSTEPHCLSDSAWKSIYEILHRHQDQLIEEIKGELKG